MNITVSPFIQSQYGSPYQRRQAENEIQREQSLADEQRKQARNAAQITLENAENPQQPTQQKVSANRRAADIGQAPPSPERNFQTNKKLDEAIELKPLVISEKRHPGANAFIEVANMETDFHIIDTYA